MYTPIETQRGVVYPWVIDHVGHMNVQFYTARFDEASWQFQKAFPVKYADYKIQSDAVKAYALMKAKKSDAARKIVKTWQHVDSAEGKVINYWRIVPRGPAVSKTFGELMKS